MLLSRNCPPRTPSSSPTWIGTQPSGHGVQSHPVPHLLPIGGRRPNRLSRGSFLGNQRRSGGEHSHCYLSLTLSLSLSVQLLEPELPPLLEPELPPLLESELPPLLDSALLVRYGIFLVISLVSLLRQPRRRWPPPPDSSVECCPRIDGRGANGFLLQEVTTKNIGLALRIR